MRHKHISLSNCYCRVGHKGGPSSPACCPVVLSSGLSTCGKKALTKLLPLQLEALKKAIRQMAEAKDAAIANALAPLQEQLQVWHCHNLISSRQGIQG